MKRSHSLLLAVFSFGAANKLLTESTARRVKTERHRERAGHVQTIASASPVPVCEYTIHWSGYKGGQFGNITVTGPPALTFENSDFQDCVDYTMAPATVYEVAKACHDQYNLSVKVLKDKSGMILGTGNCCNTEINITSVTSHCSTTTPTPTTTPTTTPTPLRILTVGHGTPADGTGGSNDQVFLAADSGYICTVKWIMKAIGYIGSMAIEFCNGTASSCQEPIPSCCSVDNSGGTPIIFNAGKLHGDGTNGASYQAITNQSDPFVQAEISCWPDSSTNCQNSMIGQIRFRTKSGTWHPQGASAGHDAQNYSLGGGLKGIRMNACAGVDGLNLWY